jgi:hypothetical protein
MIDQLTKWYVELGWSAALCFMFATVILLVMLMLGADWCVRQWLYLREARAIAKRDLHNARVERDLLKWKLIGSLIESQRIDPAYRTGQFSVPKSMRDMKGVHHS